MLRTSRTVGIAVDDELRPALDEVVSYYGGGNRSEFLRRAVRDYQARLRLERLHELRTRGRVERAGRTLGHEEVLALIDQERAGADPA